MIIVKAASAGTLESSDVLVTASPNPEGGIKVNIDSPVLALYEEQMMAVINEAVSTLQVKDAVLDLKDRGAIDCVIRARTMAAICRASESTYDWSMEDRKAAAGGNNGEAER